MKYDELINKYKTPLYLYDSGVLKNRIEYIKSKLDNKYKLIYAVKANTFIIKELDDFIDGYEICSPGEYHICKDLGISANKYTISGVYKDEESIKEMLASGALRFTIESINQYFLLDKLTKELGKHIEILIRLTSGNQFGVSEDEFKEVINVNKGNAYISVKGIEYFSGTQKHMLKKVYREVEYLSSFVKEIEDLCCITLDEIEYGTGSPVFYFQEDNFDEDEYFEELNKALSILGDKKVSLEIGRSIAASCGEYITSVVDIKSNKNGNSIILDGGINHLVYYGQTMAMRIPYFDLYSKNNSNNYKIYNLYGSLCTINDIILKNIELKEPQVGDYIVFKNVGAYCATEGISLFLSRDLPSVVIRDLNGNYILVRNHEKTSTLNFPNYVVEE